jgi:dihydropyrimidinase
MSACAAVRVAAVAERLDHGGAAVLDAGGLLVLPGGVDTHCHLEQLQPGGLCDEESFATGSASALAGGTTTAVTFSAQFKGHRIRETLAEYRRRAERGAMIDYGFHQIVTDPTDAVVREELPEIVASGIRSLKVFLTYDPLHLDDRQFLRVLAAARRAGALVTVHCENYHAINWRTEALLAAGLTAPKYHAWSRPPVVEREATHRAIALAELVDQPIQVFHVSCAEAAEEIARAQARGLKVWGETCPQYLVLTAADMDRPGFEGAKFMCSPAPRDEAEHERVWGMIRAACSTSSPPTTAATATAATRGSASTARTRRSGTSRTASRASARACPCSSARAWRRGGSASTSSCGWSPRTRRGCSACTPARARSRPARTPTWCCGTRPGA